MNKQFYMVSRNAVILIFLLLGVLLATFFWKGAPDYFPFIPALGIVYAITASRRREYYDEFVEHRKKPLT